jgi:hypothetical protein
MLKQVAINDLLNPGSQDCFDHIRNVKEALASIAAPKPIFVSLGNVPTINIEDYRLYVPINRPADTM